MTSFVKSVAAAAALVVMSAAWADPTPIAVVPPLDPGLNSRWVSVDPANNPNSIGDALNVLAGGVPAVQTINQIVGIVDFEDGALGAANKDPFTALDPGVDTTFAVQYSGFLQLAAGTYQFRMRHDDGIRVILGGEEIILFPSDTGPVNSNSAVFTLPEGYYALEIVGWEQGGVFLNQFGTVNPNGGLDLTDNLWHATRTGIPEPAGVALVGLAFLAAGLVGRRRRD